MSSTPEPEPYRKPTPPDDPLSGDPEVDWYRNVYAGPVRQFTLRSFIMGSLLGGILAVSNLYVSLKTGWVLGVAITACILSFALYSSLAKIAPKLFGQNLSILENNAMQSTASSAGAATGSLMGSAMCALLMVQGHHLPWPVLAGWTFFMAVLGTVMAIPMKRQMINIEKLRFPSGTAAAETLKALYGSGAEAMKKARSLFAAMAGGSLIAWLRDAHGVPVPEWAIGHYHANGSYDYPALFRRVIHPVLLFLTKWSMIPATIAVPFGFKIRGFKLVQYTLSFEGSVIMIGAGMLMGLRTTTSMLVGAIINYGIIAPYALDAGAIHAVAGPDGAPALGYRAIVKFSLWPGASMLVTSGLLMFALQYKTILRALGGIGKIFGIGTHEEVDDDVARTRKELEKIEVPTSWFAIGTLFSTLGLVAMGWAAFDISPVLGVIAVAMSFVLSLVACRATGETDITPIGAMGKITQLTYGVLAPAKIVTNLMTAAITAGSASASADLLNDLKSGYQLGANPRQQFLAQLSGTLVGTAVVVPAFYKLIPTPDILGSDRFPAPSAQVWKAVADLLSKGVGSLHPWQRWGIVVGGVVGIFLPLLEVALPKQKKYLPSATGVGLALVIPGYNSVSMFLGALLAWGWERWRKEHAERYVTPIASGIIAGESLLAVAIALLAAANYLE